jgi:hypothetical protein
MGSLRMEEKPATSTQQSLTANVERSSKFVVEKLAKNP